MKFCINFKENYEKFLNIFHAISQYYVQTL